MKKRLIFIVFAAIMIPLVFLFYIERSVQYSRPTTTDELAFIQACDSLNGKSLTFENIAPLNGACAYQGADGGVGIESCTEDHVQQYIQSKKEKKFIPYGDGSFAVWQKDDLNDVWICKITDFEPIIITKAEYYSD